MTARERADLERRAAKAGMTVSEYVRWRTVGDAADEKMGALDRIEGVLARLEALEARMEGRTHE